MKQNKLWFVKGLRDGIPIALGYLCRCIYLGIAARKCGIDCFSGWVFMSITNVTFQAGEFER